MMIKVGKKYVKILFYHNHSLPLPKLQVKSYGWQYGYEINTGKLRFLINVSSSQERHSKQRNFKTYDTWKVKV